MLFQLPLQHRLLSFLLLVVGCHSFAAADTLRGSGALDPAKAIHLEQNWSESERLWFYHTDQGTRLLPYDLFLNLETADNESLLSSPENLLRYGFLPSIKTELNPDGLPVGFSRNKDFMGITCAACHTQPLKYKGQYLRIDGGQAMIDLPMFLNDIELALAATLTDSDKLARYNNRVAGNVPHAVIEQVLQEEYKTREFYNRQNSRKVEYGFSRLDAFGAILNKALYLTGVEDNLNPPNAPTSYPYLWDTPQHDYVEWNGSQSNSNVGALARNIGEVIGVFGEVNTAPAKWLFFIDGGYPSSIQTDNLRELEKTVARLHSPKWPDIFPTINTEQANKGRVLYEKYCLSCHLDIERTDPKRNIRVRMSSLAAIGTDPLMAKNAVENKGKTGIFEGKPRFYKKGEILGEVAPALYIANNLIIGVLKNNPLQAILAKRDARALGHSDEIHPPKYLDGKIMPRGTETSEKALLAYKARPLNGIWAAAPYLHNGSVPNLYQLLLPAEERIKTFYIGDWEFDPIHVGYVTTNTPGAFLFDTQLEGNSNVGHEYGTGSDGLPRLTDDDIWALVEYMKTL